MKYLTFSEYIDSKQELIESLNQDPVIIQSYELTKYCKISIGAAVNIRDMFILKPKELIKIKWNYKDLDNPICLKIYINNKEYDVYWSNTKIKTWLNKNTREL